MKYLQKFENYVPEGITVIEFIFDCFNVFAEEASPTRFNNYELEINKVLDNGAKLLYLCGSIKKTNDIVIYYETKSGKIVDKSIWTNGDIINSKICDVLYNMFGTYDAQKKFLEENPSDYEKIRKIGLAPGIEEEFSYLFDAGDMGLL